MVLTALSRSELEFFFDDTAQKVIEYFLKKSIISQPEKLDYQNDIPIQIPKEHIEQWIVQALGAKPVGAGSYPVDVIGVDWAADVKMLSCKLDKNGKLKNADSGETSLAQKFSDENFGDGNSLDALFASKSYDFIWTKWKDILITKYKKVFEIHNIKTIYYFIVLREGCKFHLSGIKVDLNNLDETSIDMGRSTNDSIWINNFIDNTYGHVKIYKAKKRLELRLKPKCWIDSNKVMTFDTNFHQISKNIRQYILDDKLEEYINNELMSVIITKD